MPNRLGRALSYLTEAWQMASLRAKAGSSGAAMFAGTLERMAQAGAYAVADSGNVQAAAQLAITSAWVYSDITLIANRAASKDAMPKVKRVVGEDLEDAGNHPFEMLLRKPNPLMSGSFLIRYLKEWYLLGGEAYCFISTEAPGKGEPQELWPLPANLITPRPETLRGSALDGRPVIDFEYQVNGQITWLPGENVIFWRMPNPFDWWRGLSPLTASIMGVQIDHSQGRFVRDYFRKDNAIPTALATLPQNMGLADFQATVEKVREQIESGRRILFTRSGDLTLQTLTHTLEQMQMIAAREFNRDEIDRVYGVPQGLISGGLSGDSRLAAEIAFARNTVQPLIDYFADGWTQSVGPYYGDDVVIAAPDVIPQDRALEVSEYTQYSQDRTINENRTEQDLEAITHPLAELPVRLLQYIGPTYGVLGGLAQQRPAPNGGAPGGNGGGNGNEPPEGEDEESDNEPADIGNQAGQQTPEAMQQNMAGKAVALGLKAELDRWRKVAAKEAKAGHNPAAKPFTSDIIPADVRAYLAEALDGAQPDTLKGIFDAALTYKATNAPLVELANQFRRALMRREDKAAASMIRSWDGIWQSVQKEVVSLFEDVAERRARGEVIAPATIQQMDRYRALLHQIDGELARLSPEMAADLRAAQLKAVDSALSESEVLAQSALPFPDMVSARMMSTWNRLPVGAIESMVGVLQDGSPVSAVLERYGTEAAQGMAEMLQAGLAEGKGPREVARLMRNAWDVGKGKAELIARTEMLRAHRTATHQNYRRNSNIVKGWVWNAHLGGDARTCAACLALHGSVHSLDEPMQDHPFGRCTATPQTISWADLGISGIEEKPAIAPGDSARWLAEQSAETQREILGTSYDAYNEGRVQLGDLLAWHDDPLYGREPRVRRVQ